MSVRSIVARVRARAVATVTRVHASTPAPVTPWGTCERLVAVVCRVGASSPERSREPGPQHHPPDGSSEHTLETCTPCGTTLPPPFDRKPRQAAGRGRLELDR